MLDKAFESYCRGIEQGEDIGEYSLDFGTLELLATKNALSLQSILAKYKSLIRTSRPCTENSPQLPESLINNLAVCVLSLGEKQQEKNVRKIQELGEKMQRWEFFDILGNISNKFGHKNQANEYFTKAMSLDKSKLKKSIFGLIHTCYLKN